MRLYHMMLVMTEIKTYIRVMGKGCYFRSSGDQSPF